MIRQNKTLLAIQGYSINHSLSKIKPKMKAIKSILINFVTQTCHILENVTQEMIPFP